VLAKLQAAWRKAHEAERELARTLQYKYTNTWSAPRAQQEKYERVSKRSDAAMEAVFAWLDTFSPRSWRSGVPANWVCVHLTEADALTAGQLSVVPPPGYGSYPSDSVRFARPVEKLVATGW
jgi:hypothetical protein